MTASGRQRTLKFEHLDADKSGAYFKERRVIFSVGFEITAISHRGETLLQQQCAYDGIRTSSPAFPMYIHCLEMESNE
jgi:hypothetical protein